ncbi:MAG: sulfite exporter TauE/SafE family protein [Candidatus Binatia bacterium]
MELYLRFLWLVPLGFFAGAYGTLIGAGGGFVLAPALLLLYPEESPETITSISLAVVSFNALSATLAYSRSGKIDFKRGGIFALATIPGAIAGALATTAINRRQFNLVFGLILIVVAIFLAVNPGRKGAATIARAAGDGKREKKLSFFTMLLGACLSTVFGFVSSFLGIGGGFLYVPTLVYLLGFPVHAATATSLFVLTITSFTGTATHVAAGLFQHGIRRTIALSVGAIAGAQLAAMLSQRIRADWILRSLALALGLVGLRIVAYAIR